LVKYLRLSERLSPESATGQIFTDEAAKSQYQRMRVTVFVNTILTFHDIFFYFRYFSFIYQATTLKYKAFLSSSLSISILMGSECMHHIRPNSQAPFFCDFFDFARISIFFIFVKVFSGGSPNRRGCYISLLPLTSNITLDHRAFPHHEMDLQTEQG